MVQARSPAPWSKVNARFEMRTDARGAVTTIDLFDAIGGWDGVTAKDFTAKLRAVTTPQLRININSPGGDVFEALAIYNEILDSPADVTIRVVGIAASAASIIAMAGDTIEIADGAFFMIHNAWTIAMGDSKALAQRAKVLAKIDTQLAATYAKRTGQDAADVVDMMDAETWLDSGDAVEKGFADSIISPDGEDSAQAHFDLSGFTNVPKALMGRKRSAVAPSEPAVSGKAKDGSPELAAALALCRQISAQYGII